MRVVRFYVSLFFSFFSFFFSFSSSSLSSPPSSFSSINWDPLCSVWRAGPQWQLGSSQFSVACWTPNATGILSVQCGVLDPNRDLMSSVWRAGPYELKRGERCPGSNLQLANTTLRANAKRRTLFFQSTEHSLVSQKGANRLGPKLHQPWFSVGT